MTDIEERLEHYEAKDRERQELKSLEKQVHLYREAIRYYRDELNEARDEAGVLSCAIDRFTYYHPEYAEEIKALIDDVENHQEDDEE